MIPRQDGFVVSNSILQADPGTNSSNGGVRFVGPKYGNLVDLERVVDKTQADSLRMMRIGRRDRHKLLVSAQDYFYRYLLVPTLAKVFTIQTITTILLLIFWERIGYLLDTVFVHLYTKTQNSFFHDFVNHFSLSSLRNDPWIFPGAVFLSMAASWSYLRTLRVPPPVEPNRSQKMLEFMRVLSLNGPAALACVAVACSRPKIPFQGETINSEDEQGPRLLSASSDDSTYIEDISTASQEFFREIVLKTLLPVVYLLAVLASASLVHFFLGDFFIGTLKSSQQGPKVLAVQNPVTWVRQNISRFTFLLKDLTGPLLVLPSLKFWKVTLALFSLPLLFPVAELFRVWLQYHFLAFALIHVWKFDLSLIRQYFTRLLPFGDMNVFDNLALPPILLELRRSEWKWSNYLEMQLRADFLERMKRDPNLFSEFLRSRIATKDLKMVGDFVKFWIQPIREFAGDVHSSHFLLPPPEEPRSRRLDFLLWVAEQLQTLHDFYAHVSPSYLLDQDFSAYPLALLFRGGAKALDHVRGVSTFLSRARPADERHVLTHHYNQIVEQLAALSIIMENAQRKYQEFFDAQDLQPAADMEPCIRFYMKTFRQLEHVTRLHLAEAVKLMANDVNELHFSEFPGVLPYVESLLQQSRYR
ncbi:hypothetical protein RvY_09719 [Ramazzottius varieornatus]|uniref:Uncharacterized protein n=1 Tax=Ramazzottius varieornatus TaxID=947166 RepID=A0A1D1VET0_RAMVA|nr:hypothetical protein RvY_09719 [Ramazzottius varieornatus]